MAFHRQDDFESRHSLKVQLKSVEPTWLFIDRTILKPTQFENTIEICRADMAFYRQDDFESQQFENTIEICRADMAVYRQDDLRSRHSLKRSFQNGQSE